MSSTLLLIIIIAAVIVAGVLYSRKKKSHKTGGTQVPSKPPKSGDDDQDHTDPKPNPGKVPADPKQPPPPPESPEVLLDRNGKRPGDAGYDPRVDRPADEFSPVEPVGAYYTEGAFDPDARWVGPDGVHWTDKNGVHHGPGGLTRRRSTDFSGNQRS